MTITNNVTRFLDARRVKYIAHELPAEKLGAVEAALYMDVPPDQVLSDCDRARKKEADPRAHSWTPGCGFETTGLFSG